MNGMERAEALAEPEDFARHYRRAPCLFFDCDGVIFDSNGFKRRAMRRALADEAPALVDAMEAYWVRHGGVSRFDKFEYYFTHIAPVQDDSERRQRIARAVERFSEESLTAYQRATPKPAALKLARHAGAERCVVVSGAAHVELQVVFERTGIRPLFAEVLGSPPAKSQLVQRVLEQRQAVGQDCLLIGDGGGDWRVCRQFQIPFVYLQQYSEWPDAEARLASAKNTLWAHDWPQLLGWLQVD